MQQASMSTCKHMHTHNQDQEMKTAKPLALELSPCDSENDKEANWEDFIRGYLTFSDWTETHGVCTHMHVCVCVKF